MSESMDAKSSYWEAFYAGSVSGRLPVPSQFAVFVQGELREPAFIADIGCGSGRDSLFFASHGNRVVGVDAAQAAVDLCAASAQKLNVPVRFLRSSVTDRTLLAKLQDARGDARSTVVYARFFLHAIPDEAEAHFLELARALCEGGGRLAVEFRTVRDRSLSKVTPDHYRRFIEPAAFLARAHAVGFASEYYVEGFGFAKYKEDDAYVARALLRGA